MKSILVAALLLVSTQAFATPTTAQKINCTKDYVHWMIPDGFKLVEDSIEIRSGGTLLGAMTSPVALARPFGYVLKTEKAEFIVQNDKTGQIRKGWIVVISRNQLPKDSSFIDCKPINPETRKVEGINFLGSGFYDED